MKLSERIRNAWTNNRRGWTVDFNFNERGEVADEVAKLEGENESHRNGIAYKTLFAIAQEQKEEIEALRQDD